MKASLRRAAGAFLLILPMACVACSHTYQFTPHPKVSQMAASPLAGKRLLFDLSRAPDVLNTSANGHSFHITGIRTHLTNLLTGLFGADMVVQDAAAADHVLAVELDIRLTGAFAGTQANAAATIRIRDKAGAEIAAGSASSNASFPTMGNGGRNCEIASLQAISQALDAAMAKVKQAP